MTLGAPTIRALTSAMGSAADAETLASALNSGLGTEAASVAELAIPTINAFTATPGGATTAAANGGTSPYTECQLRLRDIETKLNLLLTNLKARGIMQGSAAPGGVTLGASNHANLARLVRPDGADAIYNDMLNTVTVAATDPVNLSAGTSVTGVNGTGNNAVPIHGFRQRVWGIYYKINEIIAALKAAGVMSD